MIQQLHNDGAGSGRFDRRMHGSVCRLFGEGESVLRLHRADVVAGACGAGVAALVGGVRGDGSRADGRRARQRNLRVCKTAITPQHREQRIDVDDILAQ